LNLHIYTIILTGAAAAEFSVRAVPGFLKQFGHTRFGLNANYLDLFFSSKIFMEFLFCLARLIPLLKHLWRVTQHLEKN
jgi:hypothetical protein